MPLIQHARIALRSLLKNRGWTTIAVVILALGIGANTAIFSVVNAVLIRSLPYGDAATLVTVFGDGVARGQGGRMPVTAGDFAWWRERTGAFKDLAALRNESRRISSVETPVVPLVHAVSANYFDVLGSHPALGRGFLPGEDEPGRTGVVVLGYGIWQSIYAGDPSVIGRSIDLDGEPHTVVGVMGRDFFSAHIFSSVQPGLFVPKAFSLMRDEHATRDILVYGRLAPGQTLAMAQAEMASITADISRAHPDTNDRWGAAVVPIRELAVGQFGPTGLILQAAVSLVLLIACANVANLTLSRASERSREVALRTALGASRGRIVSEQLVESLLLSVAGGALGAMIAFVAKGPLARMIPAQAGVPFLDRVSVDASVLAFTLLISVVSGLLFGLFPAREATRVDLVEVLREGGRSHASSRGRRFRSGLVVAEVALAVVVAAAAVLMLKSFDGLQRLSPGFDADRVLTLRTSLRGEDFASPGSRLAHFEELKRRIEKISGVSRVSATSFDPPMPAAGVFGGARISLPGVPDDAGSAPSAVSSIVMPDFFETLGVPVVKGRGITADDGPDTRKVVVINQSMADRYFPGVEPLGRTFSLYGPKTPPMEIVGVVGDVMSAGTDPTPRPVFYTPYAQNPIPIMTVLMRVPEGDPLAVAREAEATAWALSRSTNVYLIQTLAKKIEDLNWRPRLSASLLGAFAGLALLLGAAGIYAVISYTVLQRRAEIGLRMALGARASEVLTMILRGGLGLTAKGVAAGVVASLLATRALKGLLYGVSPGDPATLASVALVLLLVASAACLVPAFRACRLNPGVVLKE